MGFLNLFGGFGSILFDLLFTLLSGLFLGGGGGGTTGM